MKKRKLILIGIALILLYILFGVITDGNHKLMILLTLSSVFLITIYFLKNFDETKYKYCFFLIAPMLLLFTIAGFLGNDFSRTLQYLIFIPVSSLLAYGYLKKRYILIIPLALIAFYCIANYLFNTIFIFVSNKDAEKNINFPAITLLEHNKKRVYLKMDKIIVLDFWSTSCGICFEKFPDLEELHNKYKENNRVEIYAVNFPLKRDKFNTTIKILDSIGYKFKKVYAQSSSEIENKLHFNTFPHLIIIKDGKIRYDGMFETEKNTLIFSTEAEIDKLLKE
ncbi:thioredoxin-like protein [Flavobacterium croceum DSM 17960]|uniref:Thioredoxin-like protein n=1 Tax=Flavobacterium croceum DSM 17960 TaxID=1121886 RepID=A0A2S4N4C5_9FLAO|nr:TlpA family protein disulfide reductase [Flavobacterium croceum]POS00557.1 thioredoxin-like protein [Flavobacterium croceum DSM 17960]